ncbi:ATP-binding cassette domain-containing protein [Paenibacillus chartarius]|uniref:ATP-binding cassette domain-containing protein n=1 Tax=Paenibacillus chartarius TaxID=747481 RepID=A0ABV6DFT8_9BACL
MPIIAKGLEVVLSGKTGPRPLFRDLSLTLEDRQITLLVGVTGSGKSTLLDALSGLRPLDKGTVEIDGLPLWTKGKRVNRDANRKLGAVFQQPEQGLFAPTVRKELQYTLRPLSLPSDAAEQRIAEALRTVELPPGILERSPFLLSTGQQRRVVLASADAAKPSWLFLDEPTAALDPAGAAAVTRWLTRLRAEIGCGMVVATHDLDTFLPLADRVLVLEGGALAADASPAELAARPELLLQAGVGLPAYIETAVLLRHAGIAAAATPSAAELAEAIGCAIQSASRSPAAGAVALLDSAAEGQAGAEAQPQGIGQERIVWREAARNREAGRVAVREKRAECDVELKREADAVQAGTKHDAEQAKIELDTAPAGKKYDAEQARTEYDAAQAGTELDAAQAGTEYDAAKAGTEYDAAQAGTEYDAAHVGTELDAEQARTEYDAAKTGTEYDAAQKRVSECAAALEQPDMAGPTLGRPFWKAPQDALERLDPRAKWLFLVLVTSGIMLQRTWAGLAWSAAGAIVLSLAVRFPLHRYSKLWAGYLLVTGISMALAGAQWGELFRGEPGWFSSEHALATALSVLRFPPAIVLGLLFARTTSPMQVKRGLEQSLGRIAPLRVPVELLTFCTAMLFRFVPLLTGLWERFSRIVRMRGKSRAKPGSVGVRDVPAVLTPLLVTSFQLAEQLADAVEARGYVLGQTRTSSVRLKLSPADWWTMLIGTGLLIGLILLG